MAIPTLINPSFTAVGSTTVTPRVGVQFAPPPPAWLVTLALAAGQWGEIPGTNLSSVAPSPTPVGNEGPAAKVTAYTGMAIVNGRLQSVASGGHNDYSGNEVDDCNLLADVPSWVQALAPTPAASVAQNVTHYADGRPSSRHTYYSVVGDNTNNRVMLVGGYRYGEPGGDTGKLDAYNLGSASYSPASTFADLPASGTATAIWDDPATGDIYLNRNWDLWKWALATNSWSQLIEAGSGCNGNESASAWDSTRERALILDFETGAAFTADKNATAFVARTLTGADAAAVTGVGKLGMIYVPDIDAFLVRKDAAGGTVYRIDAETFAVTQFATTGGGSVPATSNGPYRKWLYEPTIKCAIYVPAYTGNVWALRIV